MEQINEQSVRDHIAFLRHGEWFTVCHCQDVASGRPVGREVVRGADSVVDFARRFNGKGNIFVGRNPRLDESGKTLAAITCFSLDIDPERPKGTAASDAQRAVALSVARRVLAVWGGGGLLDSGNGYQIFYTWEPIKGDEKFYEDFAKKAAAWVAGLQPYLRDSGCVLDSIHDGPRLVKLAGTTSTKGTPDQWRQAAFVGPLPGPDAGARVLSQIQSAPTVVGAVGGRTGGADATRTEPVAGRPFEDDVVTAAKSLAGLSQTRGDDYHQWLQVGMSLRGLGDAGLALWDNWSKRRKGYEAAACAEKWGTFDVTAPGEGITLGSLVHWAEEDRAVGGGSPAGRRESASVPESRLLRPGDYLAALPARLSGESAGIEMPTGIPELDQWGPLLKRGALFTVGALTNVGKTALALTVAAAVARLGRRVLIFSTETQPDEVFDRLILALGGGKSIEAATKALEGIGVDVSDGFEPDAAAVEAAVAAVKPDLFIFDHLQHIGSDSEFRVQEISRFVTGVHDTARRHNCAALLTSQLNRAADQPGAEPSLRHLKDCSTIEHESRAVLILKRLNPNLAAETFPVACTLAKNKGRMGTCQLVMNTKASRFETMTGG